MTRCGVGEAQWLPPGAWAEYEVEDGGEVVLGIDTGGGRAASVIVAVTRDLRVAAVHVYEGDEAVLTVSEKVLELARRFNVVEAAYDPWR